MEFRKKNEIITLEVYNKNLNNRVNKKCFYYLNDIKNSLKKYKLETSGKKKEIEERLFSFFDKLNQYENNIDIDIIKKFQRNIKNRQNNSKIKTQGIGIINKEKCSNKEDFYTFESIYEVDDVYFFSYEDNGFIYFFDIRSFKKLLQNDKLNPYTRDKIPDYAIYAFNKREKELNLKNIYLDHEIKEIITKEQEFKNRVVSIFQKIDMMDVNAGGLDIKHFLEFSSSQLKMLYKSLEDIWNYRAELTLQKKKEIVPLNNVFNMSVYDFIHISSSNKRKLQNILLDEIDKLISSSPSSIHRGTGCYYVLIALVEVSAEYATSMPWLIQPS